jgi:uncharacterized OsmC-like protein
MSTQTSAERVVNGVDTDAVAQTMTAIDEDPTRARFNFRLSNFWVTGTHNRALVKDFSAGGEVVRRDTTFFVYDKDEHPLIFGQDRGANPVEYLLAGLAGCVTTTLVLLAARKGITLTKVDARLDGDLDAQGMLGMSESARSGFEAIHMTMDVEGDAPREELAELVRLATERSPVADTVRRGTRLEVGLAD